jgi:uncharacterized membrane protein
MGIKTFFSKEQQEAIVQAIVDAENATSGEIRVHMESSCKCDVLDRAAQIFKKLKMHKTELRDGALIYLAIEDRKFVILGDAGINAKVPDGFWDEIKTIMMDNFKKDDFVTGLTVGIRMIGEKLKTYFPLMTNDENELSNEISFGA